MEPLVDTVDSRAVVSEFTPLLEIDILTCSKQDLTFSSEFSIRMRRNDNVHGLVAYFDVAFTNLSHPAVISTSPFTQYTHWKQTIFYLRDALRVRAGDVLEGQISVRPNAKNERDLDISMQLDFDGAEGKLHTLREYRLR
jgi:protein arginine N-methyltransferase 1